MALQKPAVAFAAGAAGGFANSLAVWIFGILGITAAMGVGIAPALSAGWLYPRIVWGGLWGLLLLLPIRPGNWVFRGILFSLGPTLVQLLIVFPYKARTGMFGLDLGMMTPGIVVLFNLVWGLVASWIYDREIER